VTLHSPRKIFFNERMAADAPLAIHPVGVDRCNVGEPSLLRREFPQSPSPPKPCARGHKRRPTTVAKAPQRGALIPVNGKVEQLFRFAFPSSPG
jgi:hypothetical protein